MRRDRSGGGDCCESLFGPRSESGDDDDRVDVGGNTGETTGQSEREIANTNQNFNRLASPS